MLHHFFFYFKCNSCHIFNTGATMEHEGKGKPSE